MDNKSIAKKFSLLAKLMEVHDENPFKIKSYSNAAFNIERIPVQLSSLPSDEIFKQKGIGPSIGNSVIEILSTGNFTVLEDFLTKTPPGVLEIMQIKGLGPKKVRTIWKEMEIETPGELLHACTENRLARYKGFNEKTQQNIEEAIHFFMKSKGSLLYAEAVPLYNEFTKLLSELFPNEQFVVTGDFSRQLPVITGFDFICSVVPDVIEEKLQANGYISEEKGAGYVYLKKEQQLMARFFYAATEQFYNRVFETSCSEGFLNEWNQHFKPVNTPASEAVIFEAAGIPYLPPYLRENFSITKTAIDVSSVVQPTDIKGIIHSHSTWSDGGYSIEKMAEAAISNGFEYLVISDHSKSAFYANGLQEERIIAQQQEIDLLNKKLAPFKIFKSIECDILYNGELDYSDDILSSFDLVIASIHSNIKMNEEKAMSRLIKAIENPYTTILGHLTGRLLLSRPGYPVNHRKIIDACVQNKVVIELNANPRRLDIDWQHISYALEKGAKISINPDAHKIEEFGYTKYGVLVAQKAAVTPADNLSSYGLSELENFLKST